MDFGIMFFSSADTQQTGNKYKLLIEAAKFADEHDFCCVWTPECHFHKFGGLFPNPSVVGAGIATITRRLQIRAGSLISPLHHSIRIAEDWSIVDNLSNGRVAISFGSGWNTNNFVFFPERYANRQAVMYEQIEIIRRLWRGEPLVQQNSFGKDTEVLIYPKPVQKRLPVWVTSSGNADTFISAGAIGANLLTHLIGQDLEKLAVKIQLYREARERNNFDPSEGKVSLMLHTFLGPDVEIVKRKVRTPFREYLRAAISLEEKAALGGGAISGGHKINPHDIPERIMEELLDLTFERYFQSAALMGTPSSCQEMVWRVKEIGVDEIACLIDFIDDPEAVMASLTYLDQLRAAFSADALAQLNEQAVSAFMDNLED
jgi:natural product biosynthesis luciferase-like monooxygenase protein